MRSMCKMLEEMREEAAEKKEAQIIYGLIKDGIITVDTAKAHFKLTDNDLKKIMQNHDIRWGVVQFPNNYSVRSDSLVRENLTSTLTANYRI